MDQYDKLAAIYFDSVEGRGLYPGFGTWHWYGFAAAVSAMAAYFAYVLRVPGQRFGGADTVVAMLLDLVFVCVWVNITGYKDRAMLAPAKASLGDSIRTIEDCRRGHLIRLCQVNTSRFLTIAKECAELISLRKAHRLGSDLSAEFYARKLYDPDSKARLLTIVMGAIALLAALIVHTLPEDTPSVLALLADDGLWSLIGVLITVAAMLFAMALGLHAVWVSCKKVCALWWTTMSGRTTRSQVAMRYFMRDLVRLHTPASMAAESTLSNSEAASLESASHVALSVSAQPRPIGLASDRVSSAAAP